MHGHVNAEWVKAWLVYHNYVWNGDALFFFYNVGGLKDDERHYFKDFIDAGILDITDLTSPSIQSLYPSWYYHQLLYINDCLQRARFRAEFVFFFDFDEFLQVDPHIKMNLLRQPEILVRCCFHRSILDRQFLDLIPARFNLCSNLKF